MAKANRLTVHDVREVFRLLGECREVGARSEVWHEHFFAGLCRLTGAQAATGFEGTWASAEQGAQPTQIIHVGFDSSQLLPLARWRDRGGLIHDPVIRAMGLSQGRHVTRSRRQLVDDDVWYSSPFVTEHRLISGVDDCINSLHRFAGGAVDFVSLHREPFEPPFSCREVKLVHLAHLELSRLGDRQLARALPGEEKLSPRLQQTL